MADTPSPFSKTARPMLRLNIAAQFISNLLAQQYGELADIDEYMCRAAVALAENLITVAEEYDIPDED